MAYEDLPRAVLQQKNDPIQLRVARLRVARLRVARLRVARLRVARLRVVRLRVAGLVCGGQAEVPNGPQGGGE